MRPSQMTWEVSNFTEGEKKKKRAKQNTTPDIVTASMLHWELLIGFEAPLQYSWAPDCTLSIQARKIARDLWILSDQFTKNTWSE